MNNQKEPSEVLSDVVEAVVKSADVKAGVIELTAVLQEVPKESLLQSGRFQATMIGIVINVLLAALPVLAQNADPVLVAQLRDSIMLSQVLVAGLFSIFVIARTQRNK